MLSPEYPCAANSCKIMLVAISPRSDVFESLFSPLGWHPGVAATMAKRKQSVVNGCGFIFLSEQSAKFIHGS
jgi:hypothetical protein